MRNHNALGKPLLPQILKTQHLLHRRWVDLNLLTSISALCSSILKLSGTLAAGFSSKCFRISSWVHLKDKLSVTWTIIWLSLFICYFLALCNHVADPMFVWLFQQCYFSHIKTCFSGHIWERRDSLCYFTWAEFLYAAIDHLLYKSAGIEQRF